jgi:hypothetical protein
MFFSWDKRICGGLHSRTTPTREQKKSDEDDEEIFDLKGTAVVMEELNTSDGANSVNLGHTSYEDYFNAALEMTGDLKDPCLPQNRTSKEDIFRSEGEDWKQNKVKPHEGE